MARYATLLFMHTRHGNWSVSGLTPSRLAYRVSYLTKRYRPGAYYWQFTVWIRLFLLTMASLAPEFAAANYLSDQAAADVSNAQLQVSASPSLSLSVSLSLLSRRALGRRARAGAPTDRPHHGVRACLPRGACLLSPALGCRTRSSSRQPSRLISCGRTPRWRCSCSPPSGSCTRR